VTLSSVENENGAEPRVIGDRERWQAACAYLFFFCFYSLWKGKNSAFVRFHARQGFVLFAAECAALLLVAVVDHTLGRIPFAGLMLTILVQSVVYLSSLFLSAAGFIKALLGKRWVMPLLGAYAERIPSI